MKKTATLITGAGGGLGRSCVEMAHSLDTDLIIATDLTKPEFSDKSILCYETNVTNESSIHQLKETLEEQNISVKFLINNAGVFDYFPISESNEKLLDKTLKVNLYGPILTISAFRHHLAENKGRVIQVSSVSVKLPVLFLPYANSKIALEAFSTSMRQELSILGVKLIMIRPGAMDTNLIHDMKKIDNPIPDSILDKEFKTFTGIAKKDVGKMVHPDKVAQLIFRALIVKKPKRIYSINKNRKIGIVLLFPLWLRDKLIVGQVRPKS